MKVAAGPGGNLLTSTLALMVELGFLRSPNGGRRAARWRSLIRAAMAAGSVRPCRPRDAGGGAGGGLRRGSRDRAGGGRCRCRCRPQPPPARLPDQHAEATCSAAGNHHSYAPRRPTTAPLVTPANDAGAEEYSWRSPPAASLLAARVLNYSPSCAPD